MFVLDVPLTVISLVLIGAMLLAASKLGSLSGKYFVRQQTDLGNVNGYIEEMMQGQKVVKVFCHEEKSLEQFRVLNERLRESADKANKISNIMMPVNANLGNISYVLCAVVGAVLALNGFSGLTVGTLVSFLSLNKSCTQPITQISQQMNNVLMALAGAGRIFEMMDEEPEQDNGYVELVNAKENADGALSETKEKTGLWAWKHFHKADGTTTYMKLQGDVTFDGVDFGNGRAKVSIYSGAENDNATTVSLYLDDMTGQPDATITLPATGDWAKYVATTADVDPNVFKGTHKLYLAFSGGDKYCANMDWLKFYNEGDDNPLETEGPLYYYKGCAVTGSAETNIERAVEIAKKADVVVFAAGTNLEVSDESHDRTSIALPGDQQRLLEAVYAANPNVVLLLQTCSSVDVSWAEQNVPAIVEAWYGGQAQGKAIADVLYGDYNPGGKLTSTWYASQADLPKDMMQYDIRKAKYTYMYYDKTPLYPFGFGLSYTTFAYDNLAVSSKHMAAGDSVVITFDVTNTGKRAGAEVAQLYTHAQSDIERPLKELKGFARVELEPGETKTVRLALRHDLLTYFNEQTNTFDVEEGTVDILIGASSADIRLRDKVTTEAATVKTTYKSTTDGIANAVSNPALGGDKVYTLQGTCVGTADNIGALQAGIYIMNGDKVAVTK